MHMCIYMSTSYMCASSHQQAWWIAKVVLQTLAYVCTYVYIYIYAPAICVRHLTSKRGG